MTSLLVTATLEPDSGFDMEAAQNTFAFQVGVAVDAAVVLDIHNAVASFYTGVASGATYALGGYLNSMFSRAVGACSLKMYDITSDLDGTPHGSPIAEDTFTLPAAISTINIPPQAAVVMTLRGRDALEYPVEGAGVTRPRQRRSGRLFFGSLNRAAADDTANQHSRPHATLITDLLAAGEALQDALVDGDYVWGVWSRTAAAIYGIERVEVDNSFDVLRSRKIAPSARSSRTFAPEPALVLGA